MGADLPDESDVPPDGHADRQDDQRPGGRTGRPAGPEAETRNRQDYYTALRTAVSTEESITAQRLAAAEQDSSDKWSEQATESRWMWTEYQLKWPPEERAPADSSADPPGSWRGEGDRFLKVADNNHVEAACDRIAEREEGKISPAMRAVESQDPDRHLSGYLYPLECSSQLARDVALAR